MTETLAYGYSFDSTQRELSNEYQYDRVGMFFNDLCILVLWTKVASALEGLTCCSLVLQDFSTCNRFRTRTSTHIINSLKPLAGCSIRCSQEKVKIQRGFQELSGIFAKSLNKKVKRVKGGILKIHPLVEKGGGILTKSSIVAYLLNP